MKTRGPYRNTKRKMVVSRPDNFFAPTHEHKGLFVSWADAVDRGGGQISVLYKVYGERKQFRCPRFKTAYLDDKGIEFAKLEDNV